MLPVDELGISLMSLQIKLVLANLSVLGSRHMMFGLLTALDASNVAAAADQGDDAREDKYRNDG